MTTDYLQAPVGDASIDWHRTAGAVAEYHDCPRATRQSLTGPAANTTCDASNPSIAPDEAASAK
jgi:hypothetical protein